MYTKQIAVYLKNTPISLSTQFIISQQNLATYFCIADLLQFIEMCCTDLVNCS